MDVPPQAVVGAAHWNAKLNPHTYRGAQRHKCNAVPVEHLVVLTTPLQQRGGGGSSKGELLAWLHVCIVALHGWGRTAVVSTVQTLLLCLMRALLALFQWLILVTTHAQARCLFVWRWVGRNESTSETRQSDSILISCPLIESFMLGATEKPKARANTLYLQLMTKVYRWLAVL